MYSPRTHASQLTSISNINIMNIKKILVLSALAMASFTQAVAQDQKNDESTWKFIPHWYIQLQAGANETLGEAKFFDLLSPSAQVAVGYQFNHTSAHV